MVGHGLVLVLAVAGILLTGCCGLSDFDVNTYVSDTTDKVLDRALGPAGEDDEEEDEENGPKNLIELQAAIVGLAEEYRPADEHSWKSDYANVHEFNSVTSDDEAVITIFLADMMNVLDYDGSPMFDAAGKNERQLLDLILQLRYAGDDYSCTTTTINGKLVCMEDVPFDPGSDMVPYDYMQLTFICFNTYGLEVYISYDVDDDFRDELVGLC